MASLGEFNCLKCKNKWKSANSFENVGQRCNKCKCIVVATKQKPLKPLKKTNNYHNKTKEERHLKGIGPFFGEFKCSNCQKRWFSAYCWFADDGIRKLPQRCNKCKANRFPCQMRPLEKSESESTKPHQVHLCAKCKQLGFSCETLKWNRGLKGLFSRMQI